MLQLVCYDSILVVVLTINSREVESQVEEFVQKIENIATG